MTPSPPSTPRLAWARRPTAAYARCIRREAGADPDPELASRQHRGYVEALREAGVRVEHVPAADHLPDACFVEDGAIVLDRRVVITRPGAAERRAELPELVAALSSVRPVVQLREPATLDGGDVMRLGDRLLVGRSRRTNDAGIEQLRAIAAEEGLSVVAVEVPPSVLHLKSVCSALDDRSVVLDATALAPAVLQALDLEVHAVPEPLGANVLALGDRVLVSASAPGTARLLAALGHRVVTVELSELHRGDGALSCLSLREPPPGGWSV